MRKTKKLLEMGEEAWDKYQKELRVLKVGKYRRRVKQKLFDYKGGKCKKCGYDEDVPDAYAFHHRDPDEKEFTLSQHGGRSLERLKKEVDKCDLLCVRCHAEVHHELRNK